MLLIGFASGILVAAWLAGCSTGTSVVRIFDAITGDEYTVSAEGERQMQRFDGVYNRFATRVDRRQRQHFQDAFVRIRSAYVRAVPEEKLMDAALQGVRELNAAPNSLPPEEVVEKALDGMTKSLDPHSAYLNPEEFKEMHVSTKGEFGGLGLEVTMDDGRVKVVSPIEDTPAFRAGLKPGDVITHIDGTPIKGMSLMDSVRRMRGTPGTDIRLGIERTDARPFEVTLTRAIIKIQSVRWRVEGDIGYIRVASFTEKVEEGIESAVSGLHSKLGPRMRGIVLDLRNNPGGLLDQSLVLADAFLEGGRIVSVRGRQAATERAYDAQPGDIAKGIPMVALVNGGSASAAEIVAGALQDNGRAVIMGSQSFGKGSVQTITPLPVQGGLRLTTALFYRPAGYTIQAKGVAPDIALRGEKTDESKLQREADLPGALDNIGTPATPRQSVAVSQESCPSIGDREDRQIGCAIEYLRAGSRERFLTQVGGPLSSM